VPRRRGYSLADAAFEVLKLTGRPMWPTEIAAVAIANGLVRSTTPGSVNAAIWAELRTSPTPRFEKTGMGYRLANGAAAIPPRVTALPSKTGSSPLADPLKKQLVEIRKFLRGETAGVDANTICIWLEFCALLELHNEVVQLFSRISEDSADPFLYGRARKLSRVSRMRVED